MTKDEALLMAINTLCNCGLQIGGHALISPYIHETVYACKEALEQPTTQEPMIVKQDNGILLKLGYDDLPNGTPFYTHPKQWQTLSDDEIWDIANFLGKNKEWDSVMFAKTIEKALKEKN